MGTEALPAASASDQRGKAELGLRDREVEAVTGMVVEVMVECMPVLIGSSLTSAVEVPENLGPQGAGKDFRYRIITPLSPMRDREGGSPAKEEHLQRRGTYREGSSVEQSL